MRPSRSPGSAANYCVARAFASQSAAACGDRRLLVRARDEGHRRFRLREKVVAGHVSPPSDPTHQCDERTKERSDSEDGKDGLVPLESARSDEQDVEVHRDGLREWGRRRWGRRRGWGRHAQADQLSTSIPLRIPRNPTCRYTTIREGLRVTVKFTIKLVLLFVTPRRPPHHIEHRLFGSQRRVSGVSAACQRE